MSTSCSIGYRDPATGKIHWVYSHSDGYPSGAGKTLAEYYNTLDKVKALVSHGHISRLYASLLKPEGHSFDHMIPGYCVFYGRDRGDTHVDAEISAKAKRKELCDNDYAYLFDNGEWLAWDYKSDRWSLLSKYQDSAGNFHDEKQHIKRIDKITK